MPEFSTPFCVKNSDRKLTTDELIRAIRFNIAAEYEATQLYEQLADSIDNEEAKKVLREIADDEKVHVGCFTKLLNLLYPKEIEFTQKGEEEVTLLLNQ